MKVFKEKVLGQAAWCKGIIAKISNRQTRKPEREEIEKGDTRRK